MTWLQRHWWWVLVVITLVGAGLRLWRIGEVPYGYTFDEAGIIYDAWSISMWHRDQFAHFMPLSFESFGDYKPPLLIYTLAILYKLFGLHEIFIRLVSAFAGIGSIVAIFLLCQALFFTDKRKVKIGLLAALIVAISPWSIHLSRLGFEQNLTFFLGLMGTWLLFLGIRKPNVWFGAALLLAASMYTFHTAKVFVPGLLVFFIWLNRKQLSIKHWLIPLVLWLVLVGPLIYSHLFTTGGTRAKTLLVYTEAGPVGSLSFIVTQLATNLTHYASPGFWAGGWDGVSLRHAVPGYGVLLWPTFGVFVCLTITLVINKTWRKRGLPLLILMIIGILPALISRQSPHVLRSQFGLIGATLFISYGIVYWWDMFNRHAWIRGLTAGCIGMATIFTLIQYEQTYFSTYAIQSAPEFQYGYKAVFQILSRYPSEKIIFSDTYKQPYIYTLLYNRIGPQQFLWGGLNRYEFHPIDWQAASPGRIYVGSSAEIPPTDPAVVATVVIPHTNQVVWVVAKL